MLECSAEVVNNPMTVGVFKEHISAQFCPIAISMREGVITSHGKFHFERIYNLLTYDYSRIFGYFTFKSVGICHSWTVQSAMRKFYSPGNVNRSPNGMTLSET